MRRIVAAALAICLVNVGLMSLLRADEPEKAKYTIKEVMVKAHKEGLYKKIVMGTASQDEKDMLVEYYTALPLSKPPRGDAKAWKDKSEAMLRDAKAVAANQKDAIKSLNKSAGNCMGCHNAHKGR